MKHNYLSLFASRCTVYLQNSKFMHNKGVFGGAIAAHDSTVVFVGYNHFCNNSASETGGGVFAQSSVIDVLRGSAAYIGNSAAKHGGGIRVTNSSIHFTRDQGDGARVLAGFDKRVNKSYIFAQNSASLSGGGISLNSSIINLKGGNLKFSKNLAYVGGGMSSDFSHIFLDDLVVFESNSAVVGGAVAVRIGTWNSTASRFIHNLAESSAEVLSIHSGVNLTLVQLFKCQPLCININKVVQIVIITVFLKTIQLTVVVLFNCMTVPYNLLVTIILSTTEQIVVVALMQTLVMSTSIIYPEI